MEERHASYLNYNSGNTPNDTSLSTRIFTRSTGMLFQPRAQVQVTRLTHEKDRNHFLHTEMYEGFPLGEGIKKE